MASRGYAAFANGYAAAGKDSSGSAITSGDADASVFLISQTRLSHASTVEAEIQRLAEFLEVENNLTVMG